MGNTLNRRSAVLFPKKCCTVPPSPLKPLYFLHISVLHFISWSVSEQYTTLPSNTPLFYGCYNSLVCPMTNLFSLLTVRGGWAVSRHPTNLLPLASSSPLISGVTPLTLLGRGYYLLGVVKASSVVLSAFVSVMPGRRVSSG